MKALSYALLTLHQTLTFQLNTSTACGSLKVRHLLPPEVSVATFRTHASKAGDKRLQKPCLGRHRGWQTQRQATGGQPENTGHHEPAVTLRRRTQGHRGHKQLNRQTSTTSNGMQWSKLSKCGDFSLKKKKEGLVPLKITSDFIQNKYASKIK